jgi:hypothetical protein
MTITSKFLQDFANQNNLSIAFERILEKECLVVRDNNSGDLLSKGVIQAGTQSKKDELILNILNDACSRKEVKLSLCFGEFSAPLGTKVFETSILGKECLVVRDAFGIESRGVIQAGNDQQRNRLIESILTNGGFKKVSEPLPQVA